ncbi:hypothetical protein [Sabulibacter ruber]|uniref:hypothetical protein n=1 Tax=Sabulibacter ruber TaxID=2811901 RepID=UPI001A968308|nr:hypothetical protein [Sabulibacter ruber]
MENQQPSAASQDATSYSQDSNTGSSANQGKGGLVGSITSGVKNIQMPQAVKNLGSTVGRSYNSMSTTQKVLGGAALLGATYWVANNQGWIGGQSKVGKKSKGSSTQNS